MISSALAYGLLSGLTSLNLQRCYQLDTIALTLVLTASAQPAASLTTLAVSHLFLYNWPSAAQSLHTFQAQAQAKSSTFDTAPSQLVLFTAEPAVGSQQPASGCTEACAKPLAPRTSGLQILALHNCTKVSAEALQCLATACPQLEMLLLGGCSFAPAMSRAGELGSPVLLPRRQPQHWLHCMDIPVDSALVHSLVEPASRLPHLKLLELSHAPALTAAAVAADLAQQRNRVQVVNLCNTEGVQVGPLSLCLAVLLTSSPSWRLETGVNATMMKRHVSCFEHTDPHEDHHVTSTPSRTPSDPPAARLWHTAEYSFTSTHCKLGCCCRHPGAF